MSVEKSRKLKPFLQPAPPPRPAFVMCCGCRAFRAEVQVPYGDGAIAMCWLCAHAHVDHEAPIGKCLGHECECPPEAVYPEHMIKARQRPSLLS